MKEFYQQFKTPIVTVIILFVALFIYTKLAGPIPFYVNSVNTTKTDLFTSSGVGTVTEVPDTAIIYVGVTQTSSNALDAKNKTNTLVNKIISDIKALGISEKDIKTTNYSINPNYGTGGAVPMMYPIRDGGNNITGYTVMQNLEVKINPTEKVNKVIDAVTKSGANLVGGVSFTFSEELSEKLENQARKEAVADAKKKAQNLANASGIRLGKIVNVIENSSFPRYMPLMKTARSGGGTAVETQVTPGENTVTVTVTIYYETN
jgi:hypothetical protein